MVLSKGTRKNFLMERRVNIISGKRKIILNLAVPSLKDER